QQGAEVTLEALGVGAFDYLPKSESGHPLDPQRFKHDLIEKIEAAAHSPLGRQLHLERPLPDAPLSEVAPSEEFRGTPEVIVLGTSTGGPKALQELLPQLPADLSVGIIVVQHMPPGFTAPFARRLDSLSKLKVREASQGDVVEPGSVYIAPAGQHTTILRRGSKTILHLSSEPSGTLHKPSVDVAM